VDGRTVVADFTDYGQEVARYLDNKYALHLFPAQLEGLQSILARYIENDLEGVGFKINDTYILPRLPLVERGMVIRHKERKFGRGCLEQWTASRPKLIAQFAEMLQPFDNILAHSPFLVDLQPRFVDYDLFGVIENYLYNGKTRLPALPNLRRWHRAMRA
jgi:glutathione S-transferase